MGDGQEVLRNGAIYAAKWYGRVKKKQKKLRPEAEKSQSEEVIHNHKSRIVF